MWFTDSGNSYSSSSEAVEFTGQNSVAVDVSVAATVTASAGGKDIELVADDAELTAATTPALLMKLTVGTQDAAITSEGATAAAELAGKPDNFEVTTDSGEYKYSAKASASGWEKTTVKLSGKTNQVDVPSDMTAPTINLTWTIEKHETAPTYTDETAFGSWGADGLWLAKDSSTGFSSGSLTVEVSDGGTTYTALASDKYTVNDANWVTVTWGNITEALGGDPSGTVYIRITDGTTRYTFINN